MALVFIDGFNSGTTGLWDYVSSSGVSVASQISGMQATYSLYIPSTGMIYKVLPAADEYTIGFYYRAMGSSSASIVRFMNDGTLLGEVRRNTSSAYLEVYRDTTKIATGITTISSAARHIQIRYVPHTSTGYFQVKVDNVVDINFSGATVTSSAQINRIVIGSESTTVNGYFSNIVIDNSTFPGMLLVGAFTVNSNGYLNEWTASAGQNYQCIDEVPASDADLVYTTSTDKIDFYAGTMPDIDYVSSIVAVQVQARCMLIGEPASNQIKVGVRPGSTNYFGDAQSVGVTYKDYTTIWTTNPSTSTSWTKSDLSSLQIGIQSAGT